MVDRNAIKTNQFFIILSTVVAYLFDKPFIILVLGIVLLIGTIFTRAALFQLFYFMVLIPLGLVKPNVVDESNDPHRFSQGLGGILMLVSYILIELGQISSIGWSLSFIVMTLAFVNFAFGFCLGCFLYFQLEKLGTNYHNKKKL